VDSCSDDVSGCAGDINDASGSEENEGSESRVDREGKESDENEGSDVRQPGAVVVGCGGDGDG
jgi:hypothetical protein